MIEVNKHLFWHQLDKFPHEMVPIIVLNQGIELRNQKLSYALKFIRTGQQWDE